MTDRSVRCRVCIRVATLAVALVSAAPAATHHVTPDGTGAGDGTLRHPWSFEHVCDHPPAVKPGDTVLVHPGVYRGYFISLLRGTADRPILVRAVPGTRVILSPPEGASGISLIVAGDYTWYWGLEMTDLNVDPGRANAGAVLVAGRSPDIAVGNRLINCVMHDATGNGVSDQIDAEGTEIYGCVIFYNGRMQGDRNYAYGIYGQNRGLGKRYSNNVIFGNYGAYGMHLYSRSGRVDNICIADNVLFGGSGTSSAILIGAPSPPTSIVVRGNLMHAPEEGLVLFEEHSALQEPTIVGNTFIRGQILFSGGTTGRVFFRNIMKTFPPAVRRLSFLDFPVDTVDLPGNQWIPRTEDSARLFVMWNRYEPDRVLLVVMNSPRGDTVVFSPGPALVKDQRFAVIDVENLFGPPVVEGAYNGREIRLPLNRSEVTEPLAIPPGRIKYRHSEKDFGVFLMVGKSAQGRAGQSSPGVGAYSD